MFEVHVPPSTFGRLARRLGRTATNVGQQAAPSQPRTQSSGAQLSAKMCSILFEYCTSEAYILKMFLRDAKQAEVMLSQQENYLTKDEVPNSLEQAENMLKRHQVSVLFVGACNSSGYFFSGFHDNYGCK